MIVKTLQDYYSQDYSLSSDERKQLAVIPMEDFKTLITAMVFMTNWQQSRVAMARLKHQDATDEIRKEQKELEPMIEFLESYDAMLGEEKTYEDDSRSDG